MFAMHRGVVLILGLETQIPHVWPKRKALQIRVANLFGDRSISNKHIASCVTQILAK